MSDPAADAVRQPDNVGADGRDEHDLPSDSDDLLSSGGRRMSGRSKQPLARFVAEPAPSSRMLHATLAGRDSPPLAADSAPQTLEQQPHAAPSAELLRAGETSAAQDGELPPYDEATGLWRCPRGCGYTCAKRQGLGGHKRNCPMKNRGNATPALAQRIDSADGLSLIHI